LLAVFGLARCLRIGKEKPSLHRVVFAFSINTVELPEAPLLT
jgi:hypothetical protein